MTCNVCLATAGVAKPQTLNLNSSPRRSLAAAVFGMLGPCANAAGVSAAGRVCMIGKQAGLAIRRLTPWRLVMRVHVLECCLPSLAHRPCSSPCFSTCDAPVVCMPYEPVDSFFFLPATSCSWVLQHAQQHCRDTVLTVVPITVVKLSAARHRPSHLMHS